MDEFKVLKEQEKDYFAQQRVFEQSDSTDTGMCGKEFERTPMQTKIKEDILEEDMRVRSVSSEAKLEEQIFARYPLIGSKILKPETLEKLNQNSRKYIDRVLSQAINRLSDEAQMQITLALINNAKNWKNEENPNFWNYITLQFGYRDANGTVEELIKTALKNSMIKNHRLFIKDAHGRNAFKSTVVIHALSTRKSWMALFDFLFDFYKNNLNWKIIPGDPLLKLMISSLQKKLEGEAEEVAELTISSRVYSFQEGIRKLILFRPVFTRNLFEKLIGMIDAMINSEEMAVKTYEEQLCEEWFKEKITAIADSKRTEHKKTDAQREVAIDYSHIRVKYKLKNEINMQIVLPDIRLKRKDVQGAMLVIYYNDSIALQQNLSWYGNELGKTLIGTSVTLPEYTGSTDIINIRVKISCDAETIFDSESTMDRRVLMFDGVSEVNTAQIHRGNYTLVIPADSRLDAEYTDVTEIDSFRTPGLRAYFLELHDGYMLFIDGRLLAFDSENGTDIRVIPPSESASLPRVTTKDAECYLAYRDSACTIIFGNADNKQQFIIMKNGEQIGISDLKDEGNGLAFVCPLSGDKDFCRIQVIDLESERLSFDYSFMLVTEAKCSFDREFYFSTSDYKDSLFYAKIDNYCSKTAFSADDDEVRLPYGNGELHADIPKVCVKETTGEWLNGQSSAWFIGDIPQNSRLEVENPKGTTVRFFVGGKDIMYDGKGSVTLGNVIQSLIGADDLNIAQVDMLVSGRKQSQRYPLTRVYYREGFLSTPEFWYSDGKLFWNHGGTFVGKQDRIFTLTLSGENDYLFEFKMNVDTESIDIPEDMPIGNYQFKISIQAGSLFKKVKEVIADGYCIIGDQNLLRFNRRRIKIDAITDESNERAGYIEIKACYIDRIEFAGVEETSEGLCPVYKGVLFTDDSYGGRYEFSFKQYVNKRGVAKMIVNPVRIVYVGDTALCITDPDGDGLYYYNYYDKYSGTKVYALTDREYTKATRHKYSIADLYSYRTERI